MGRSCVESEERFLVCKRLIDVFLVGFVTLLHASIYQTLEVLTKDVGTCVVATGIYNDLAS